MINFNDVQREIKRKRRKRIEVEVVVVGVGVGVGVDFFTTIYHSQSIKDIAKKGSRA